MLVHRQRFFLLSVNGSLPHLDLHKCLILWEKLPEDEKEKDRDARQPADPDASRIVIVKVNG